MKRGKFLILPIAATLAISTIAFKEDLFQVSKNLDIFASLYKEININYVDETDPTAMMRTGINAMLDGLDPYTDYVPESEIEDYKLKYVSTQYGGIGAGTLFIDGKLFINEVSENNPANKQDVRPGDEILSINGITVKNKERAQISQLLRGPKGSSVQLNLLREGTVINKTIVRQEIKQPNVPYSGMLDNGIGYIKLDKFLENSAQEVNDALVEINKKNPTGLILDLRNNGGGIVGEAVRIVNFFVPKNEMVVTQKGRNPEKTYVYRTPVEPIAPNLPLIVLMNSGSASASEIVAGAFQDLDRAVVIGQRSYGKGLVQQTFNLPYNSLVKITVAKYFTPSGRCIQAMDYAHRDANGIVSKFADSVAKPFTTKIGRTVYSDNGIYPDVVIADEKVSPITAALAGNGLFFDFANSYKKSHKEIATSNSFRLNDGEYEQFVASIANKDFSYTSQTEKLLNELKKQAESENKLASVKAELEQLRAKMITAKKADLITHKDEIKRVLETQIVSRYYFDKGKVEQAFQYDKELAKAKTLFGNQTQLAAILKGDGTYKTIGKPGKAMASIN